jgi:hypothetical protein
MGQFFRVNGDYNIKVRDGGTIKLDTGTSGDTIITGNLTVQGDVTAVSSTNLEIKDRIITLNEGENGPGVTLLYSGIEIDRGTYVDSTAVPRAAFVWNETNPGFTTEEDPASASGYWQIVTGSSETSYGFADSNIKLRRVLTNSSTDGGDLTLIETGSGVVKVRPDGDPDVGVTYFGNVTDPNHLPNKYYVDYSILNNPTFQIRAPGQNTRVIIADKEVTPNNISTGGSLAYYQNQTGYPIASDLGAESGIGFIVDGQLTSTFYQNRVQLQDLEIIGSEIRHDNSNANIFINTNGTGKLQTNYGIQLDNNAVSPGMITGSHVIYSRPQSTGKSGIFFVNTENNRDELVSKNRALLFSMLF